MRVAIVGSREYDSSSRLDAVHSAIESLQPNDVVITGCCPTGVDDWAYRYAKARHHVIIRCHAPWGMGKSAGPLRNGVIVDLADRLIAFPAQDSRGTWDTVRRAKVKGIPVDIVEVP